MRDDMTSMRQEGWTVAFACQEEAEDGYRSYESINGQLSHGTSRPDSITCVMHELRGVEDFAGTPKSELCNCSSTS